MLVAMARYVNRWWDGWATIWGCKMSAELPIRMRSECKCLRRQKLKIRLLYASL